MLDGARVQEPPDLDPDTRDLIQSTVSRDAQKMIFGSIAFTVLFALFSLMLITRAFAGRATRGEQRAVIAESRERSEKAAPASLPEARLMVMRAQVEPHFLFNTLAHAGVAGNRSAAGEHHAGAADFPPARSDAHHARDDVHARPRNRGGAGLS